MLAWSPADPCCSWAAPIRMSTCSPAANMGYLTYALRVGTRRHLRMRSRLWLCFSGDEPGRGTERLIAYSIFRNSLAHCMNSVSNEESSLALCVARDILCLWAGVCFGKAHPNWGELECVCFPDV